MQTLKQTDTGCEIPRATLGELLEQAATKFSHKLFWESIDSGQKLTFEEFNQLVNGAAQIFSDRGIGMGTHVGVMLPNSSSFGIAWFALARLGSVMVPMNTRSTSRELSYFLLDGKVEYLVVDVKYSDILQAATDILLLNEKIIWKGNCDSRKWWNEQAKEVSPVGTMPISPDSLMSIQYTSGSTGFPKGCMLTQDYWGLLAHVRAFQGGQVRRVLIDKPLSYMGGMWRLLMCLVTGATACVAESFTLRGLHQRLIMNNIDYFAVTDAVASLPSEESLNSLDISWISSAGLSKSLQVGLEEKYSAPVREMYGMTEAGAILYVPIQACEMTGSGSCGIPVPYRECKIVNPESCGEVAQGEIGELWVRGRAVMLGYFGKDEATQSTVVDGWIRTGDLFTQDQAGYFYLRGRIKDSIRRSGENIASREVESVAATVHGVRECAAVGVPDDFRGQEVKLCLVLQDGETHATVPPTAVIAHCLKDLAPFKVPRYIEYFKDFPRTKSGKIAKLELVPFGSDVYDRTKET